MKHLLTTFLTISLLSNAHAAIDRHAFTWIKPLNPPETRIRDVATSVMDEEILLDADPEYANIRILDNSNNETPFTVRTQQRKKTEVREYTVEMKKTSFRELTDNQIEITLEQIKNENTSLVDPGVIVLSSKMKNFEKHITVSGSIDGNTWEVLAENKPIFDYSRFIDIRNDRVDIKRGHFAFYRILISNISEKQQSPIVNIARDTRQSVLFSEMEKTSFRREDFRIDQITFMALKPFEVKTSTVTREYTANDLKVVNDPDEKKSIVTFSTFNTPVSEITIVTDASNFSRKVRIEGRNDSDSTSGWHQIANGTISRIMMGQFSQNHTSIQLSSPTRYTYYRMTIQNLDSPPVEISNINIRGPVQELVFFCKPEMDYHILYGGGNINPPIYDITDVLRKTAGEDTDTYSLNTRQSNPDFKTGHNWRLLNSKTLLTIFMVGMVATLLWIIAGTSRKLNTMDSES